MQGPDSNRNNIVGVQGVGKGELGFNLGDIDPSAISFHRNSFEAKTTNDERKIEWKFELAHVLYPAKTNSVFFNLASAYGPRFATAFKHAVELCGGKPSKF